MITNSSSFSRRALLTGGTASLITALSTSPAVLAQVEPVINYPTPLRDPSEYTAYIPCASKTGPFFIYTCEFDSAWAILKTFGIDAGLHEQLAIMPIDTRIEPYYQETGSGVLIYGGDITSAYSGDYTSNFLCRTTAPVMRAIFDHYGLYSKVVHTRQRIEDHLDHGRLIFIKITVDFKEWVPATWITLEGQRIPVVLGNDHAMVVMGYNDEVVVVRDVLGPTETNWNRQYEVEVPWDLFMTCWGSQGYDGLAVGPAES